MWLVNIHKTFYAHSLSGYRQAPKLALVNTFVCVCVCVCGSVLANAAFFSSWYFYFISTSSFQHSGPVTFATMHIVYPHTNTFTFTQYSMFFYVYIFCLFRRFFSLSLSYTKTTCNAQISRLSCTYWRLLFAQMANTRANIKFDVDFISTDDDLVAYAWNGTRNRAHLMCSVRGSTNKNCIKLQLVCDVSCGCVDLHFSLHHTIFVEFWFKAELWNKVLSFE